MKLLLYIKVIIVLEGSHCDSTNQKKQLKWKVQVKFHFCIIPLQPSLQLNGVQEGTRNWLRKKMLIQIKPFQSFIYLSLHLLGLDIFFTPSHLFWWYIYNKFCLAIFNSSLYQLIFFLFHSIDSNHLAFLFSSSIWIIHQIT